MSAGKNRGNWKKLESGNGNRYGNGNGKLGNMVLIGQWDLGYHHQLEDTVMINLSSAFYGHIGPLNTIATLL